MTLPDLASAKARLRDSYRARRAEAAGQHGAAEAGARLAASFPFALVRPGDVVAGYLPIGPEIDCRPLLLKLAAAGARLALPCVIDRAALMAFRHWSPGDPLSPDACGALAPLVASGAADRLDLVLCPLVAFDRWGGRLGQGGGHYDRALAHWRPRGARAIGLAWATQEAERLPMAPHDQPLDWIVTESEAIEVARGTRDSHGRP